MGIELHLDRIRTAQIDKVIDHLTHMDDDETSSETLEALAKVFIERSHRYLIVSHALHVAPQVYRDRAIACAEAATFYFRGARRCREMGD